MAMRIDEKFKRGTRVFVSGFGKGTVIDDYWYGIDRIRVRLDKTGDCHDFGAGVMMKVSPALTSHPRGGPDAEA